MNSIQELMTSFAMLGAGWVMWLLVFLSVVGLAIALERAYFVLTTRDDFNLLRAGVKKALGAGDLKGALKLLRAASGFEARIAHAAAEALSNGEGIAAAEERAAAEASLSKLQMERNLAFLGTVGNNAPFVGLLGTVIGIIRSFVALQQGGGRVTDELFYEVGEALVATAIGILVAIPAVATFNLFQRMTKGRIARGDALTRDLLAFGRGGVEAPSASDESE